MRRRAVNFAMGWSLPSSGYRQPQIRDGGKKKVPEKRDEILIKVLVKLDEQDPFRQSYGREFVEDSIIFSKTFKGVCDRKIEFDAASDTAYFDSELEIWWRKGGFFD